MPAAGEGLREGHSEKRQWNMPEPGVKGPGDKGTCMRPWKLGLIGDQTSRFPAFMVLGA